MTARTLSEALPGVVVTVGDHEVEVTDLEASVVPPLVSVTLYDVALAVLFQLALTSYFVCDDESDVASADAVRPVTLPGLLGFASAAVVPSTLTVRAVAATNADIRKVRTTCMDDPPGSNVSCSPELRTRVPDSPPARSGRPDTWNEQESRESRRSTAGS